MRYSALHCAGYRSPTLLGMFPCYVLTTIQHFRQVEAARRWADKVPQAYWTGRILHGWARDAGRQAFEGCVNAVRLLEPARAELLSFNNRTGLTMSVRPDLCRACLQPRASLESGCTRVGQKQFGMKL